MRFRFLSSSLLRLRPLPRTLGSPASTPSLSPSPTLRLLPPVHRACFSGFPWHPLLRQRPRTFSTNEGKGGDDNGSWRFGGEDGVEDAGLFGKLGEDAAEGISGIGSNDAGIAPDVKGDIFQEIDQVIESKSEKSRGDLGVEWKTAEGYTPWGFDDDASKGEPFDFGEDRGEFEGFGGDDETETEKEKAGQLEQLREEEHELLATLKGPNRAFGDLISASGISEEMIDSLILLKDLRGVQGLPSLREIEDMKLAKDDAPSARFEMERKKQEEVAKARIRQVDEKGRAYGTGRRKCSSARVWIQPGDGKFVVNEKQFDVYFPLIDHRANLLCPFTATKTLGLFDVICTVKGGGVSGQVGAIRLGISRALQNFEPGLRENLRSSGLLTRDPRIVERKKPGKAKARKSFQWVKR